MAETKRSKTWTAVVPWVLTILTLSIGAWQFTLQQEQANRSPFLKEQLAVSFAAVDAVAILATETDPAAWETARKTFWRLYWGPLSVVENREVEAQMVALGKMIPPPQEAVLAAELPMDELRVPSLRLAQAVRELLLKSWGVDLPALEAQRLTEGS
ncbi:MAG: hypothetical protein RIC87_24345 [Kiloniellales bacterium]